MSQKPNSSQKIEKIKEVKFYAADPIKEEKYIKAIYRLLEKKPREQALFIIGISTNLRGGDLVRLTIKNATDILEKGYCVIEEMKTRNRREVYMNSEAKLVLSKYLRRRELQHAKPDEKLFVGQRGPLTRATLSKLVQRWCAEVGVPGKISSHTLRKTYGYFQYYHNGVGVAELMDDFHHKKQEITLTYIGVSGKEERQKRVEALRFNVCD